MLNIEISAKVCLAAYPGEVSAALPLTAGLW
jgi:hypothetical protein